MCTKSKGTLDIPVSIWTTNWKWTTDSLQAGIFNSFLSFFLSFNNSHNNHNNNNKKYISLANKISIRTIYTYYYVYYECAHMCASLYLCYGVIQNVMYSTYMYGKRIRIQLKRTGFVNWWQTTRTYTAEAHFNHIMHTVTFMPYTHIRRCERIFSWLIVCLCVCESFSLPVCLNLRWVCWSDPSIFIEKN